MVEQAAANQMPDADQGNEFAQMLRNALSNNRSIVHLPPFNSSDPELWFSVTKECFTAAGITDERQKFTCIDKSLDSRVQVEVRDLLVNVPAETPYTQLKREISKRLCSSQEEKTRRLLELEEMGDPKPSQFLRSLRSLAGTAVPDSMLRTLWSSRLPADMQPILAGQKELSLDKIADLADNIYDLTKKTFGNRGNFFVHRSFNPTICSDDGNSTEGNHEPSK